MEKVSNLYIGLMSGTSMDGIDAALIQFDNKQCQLVDAFEHPIPNELKNKLTALCQPGENEIDRMGVADRELANEFALATQRLLTKAKKSAGNIAAIGCHGQTIRHRPEKDLRFTLQIGDPNIIAFKTSITTIADFRRKDMAAGGEGAPLAPGFHYAMLQTGKHNRIIVNIGGIANITFLGSNSDVSGFDTGPGNGLMDRWIEKNKNKNFDRDGTWAHTGKVIPELLGALSRDNYFSKPAPKSTGREAFNLNWLESILNGSNFKPEDIQATLLELTAQTITNEIIQLPDTNHIYICGGGAYNMQLMLRLESLLHPRQLASTASLGIAPEWIEAAAFAWLAKQTLHHQTGNIPTVTGASQSIILGGIYPAG